MTATNTTTGADLFVDALEGYGVTHLFGNPGTTELPVMQAVSGSDLEYVLGLHEDIAVGMAAGYASTRRYHLDGAPPDSGTSLGVVNLHVAPGLAHGLGNVQNASASGSPLLVTAGNHSTDFQHEEPILSGDLANMVEEYTKWSAEVQDVDALPKMLRRACRVALTPPTGPVFLGLPMDVMLAETDREPEPLGPIPNAGRGDPAQVSRAVDLLEAAEDPVLVLGDHVARSGRDSIDAAVELAEATGAAVYSEMITCEINFPPDHDQWVSFIPPSEETGRAFMDSDTLVLVGCSTNTTYLPREEELIATDTDCIHVGDDVWEVGKNQPADAALVGDPGLVMRELADGVSEKISDTQRQDRLESVRDRRQVAGEMVAPDEPRDADRPTKTELARAIRTAVPEALVVNESNTSKYALLSEWKLGPTQFFALKFGGLGFGLPAAVGAAVAEAERGNERPVVGFVGDGSFLYYPQAMYSAARYDLDLSVFVPDNRNYRILKDGMLEIFGGTDEDHDYVGMDFDPGVDIESMAESQGVPSETVRRTSGLAEAVERAVETDGPALVDVLVED
jgi:benzoylformate decarboxylase